MLSSIISVKAILAVVALISVGSAAGVTATPSIIHDLTATNANFHPGHKLKHLDYII